MCVWGGLTSLGGVHVGRDRRGMGGGGGGGGGAGWGVEVDRRWVGYECVCPQICIFIKLFATVAIF